MRASSTRVPDSDCLVLALLDLLAAFPGVNRTFLFRTLEFLGFPPASCRLCALYDDGALLWQGSPIQEVCCVTSGVAQGCPLSGVLFVCIMDLVIRRLQGVLRRAKVVIIRACVADLAVALRTARGAQLVSPDFRRPEAQEVQGRAIEHMFQ